MKVSTMTGTGMRVFFNALAAVGATASFPRDFPDAGAGAAVLILCWAGAVFCAASAKTRKTFSTLAAAVQPWAAAVFAAAYMTSCPFASFRLFCTVAVGAVCVANVFENRKKAEKAFWFAAGFGAAAGVAAAMTTGAAGRMTGGRLAVLAMAGKAGLTGFSITGAGISAAAKTVGGLSVLAFSVVRSKNGAGVRCPFNTMYDGDSGRAPE